MPQLLKPACLEPVLHNRRSHDNERPAHCSEEWPLLTAALFTIARTWKQPKCPLTDEWIKKMWHIYTMEYYSAIKLTHIYGI